ncbi:MAG: hypothetical protein LBT59_13255 [Clostridiales bacterium]|nr:hypothetical protein [Clostridiales bacterium]
MKNIKKSGAFLALIYLVSLCLGVKGYRTIVFKAFDALTGKSAIGISDDAATGDAPSNSEAFIKEKSVPKAQLSLSQATPLQVMKTATQLGKTYFLDIPARAKNFLITINGGFQRVVGRNATFENTLGQELIRLDNGWLVKLQVPSDATRAIYRMRYEDIIKLDEQLSPKGIPLVFGMVPYKVEAADLPVENMAQDNFSLLSGPLMESGVDVIDIKSEFAKSGRDLITSYFKTDHHWTPEAGLWFAGVLAEKFEKSYGFSYDKSLLDPGNYTYEILPSWFLGSQGRRIGPLFTDVDDFSIIHPNFETSVESVTLSTRNIWERKEGTFEEAFYWPKLAEKKGYFDGNVWGMYARGDNPLQFLRNNNAPNDKKIVVIKHSFACVVTPFLSLACKELCVIDLRAAGRPENLYKYMEDYDPDLVLILW